MTKTYQGKFEYLYVRQMYFFLGATLMTYFILYTLLVQQPFYKHSFMVTSMFIVFLTTSGILMYLVSMLKHRCF